SIRAASPPRPSRAPENSCAVSCSRGSLWPRSSSPFAPGPTLRRLRLVSPRPRPSPSPSRISDPPRPPRTPTPSCAGPAPHSVRPTKARYNDACCRQLRRRRQLWGGRLIEHGPAWRPPHNCILLEQLQQKHTLWRPVVRREDPMYQRKIERNALAMTVACFVLFAVSVAIAPALDSAMKWLGPL